MGTRSYVGVMIGDVCRTIYIHWDGYLEGVGTDLQSLTTQDEVEAFISRGDRSSTFGGYYSDCVEDPAITALLDQQLGVKHQAPDTRPRDYTSFDELFDDCNGCWGEWYYIFRDGVWYCGTTQERSPIYRQLVSFADACDIYEVTELEQA